VHKIIIHVTQAEGYDRSVSTNASNLDALERAMQLSYEYTEILGECTYDHYQCWGMRKGMQTA